MFFVFIIYVQMLLSIAKQKNNTPLPLTKSSSGLRLPPDRYCLTQPNYQLQFYKRAIASSASQTPTNIRTQGSANVFKTPNVPPKIGSVGASSSSSGAAAGTPTFRILSASGRSLDEIQFFLRGMFGIIWLQM